MEPNNLQNKKAKFWRMVIFMLKKGMSKAKLFSDLNLLLKRGKIAGKAIHNLMLHHHHHHHHVATTHHHHNEYEFSCSKTPSQHFTTLMKRKIHHQRLYLEDDEVMSSNEVMKALEMVQSETASPVGLPGFGKSLVMEKIRSSPFEDNYGNDEDIDHVDEAADEFIKRFYKNLRKQNSFTS